MKLAPWFGVAAIATLFAAIATTGKPARVRDEQRLDFSGIDTLAVAHDSADVVIDSRRPPAAQRQAWSSEHRDVLVHRDGRTLTIRIAPDEDGESSGRLEIVAPPTIRRVVLGGSGELRSVDALPSLEIDANSYFSWEGDVADLRILHRAPTFDCQQECNDTLHIKGGIDALRVTTWDGNVSLDQADALRMITLALGPKAGYTLTKVRQVPVVAIVPYDGKVPPPPPPKQAAVLDQRGP